METAVVILNWNGANYLKKFLPALLEHTHLPGVSLYVADNASSDDSVAVLHNLFPVVNLILLDQNYGFAEGYNKALAQITADFYVLLNSDVEVTAGWLDPILDYMKVHPDVAACQPKILSYRNREKFEHAGAAGGFIDYLGYPFCRGRVFSETEKDVGQYDEIKDVFWATGACLIIRANAYRECGGLDGAFFAHMEEIDLCWRIKSRGYRIVCIPESRVFHVGGGTLDQEHPHKTYLNFRNNLLLLYKNLPENKLNSVLFARFFLDYVAAFQLLMSGNPANARSVWRARRDFHRMKNQFRQKREDNIRQTTVKDIPEIMKKSLVIGFYLLGKKTYSRLF